MRGVMNKYYGCFGSMFCHSMKNELCVKCPDSRACSTVVSRNMVVYNASREEDADKSIASEKASPSELRERNFKSTLAFIKSRLAKKGGFDELRPIMKEIEKQLQSKGEIDLVEIFKTLNVKREKIDGVMVLKYEREELKNMIQSSINELKLYIETLKSQD